MTQRTIYKLVDALLVAKVREPLEMLSQLVQHIVESDRIVMTGGRVWELDADEDAYLLKYQYGELEDLALNTRVHVSEMPEMLSLAAHPTLTSPQIEVGDRGMRVYSLSGVGDFVNRAPGPLPPFALAFTSREHTDVFADSMLVISSAASTALRNMKAAHQDKKMRRDLDQAWQIQSGLVPDHHKTFADYDIFGISVPESVVGGDYFDYLQRTAEGDRLGLVISDAASKGLPAAVQALFVSGALRMAASFDTKMTSLVARLNTLIYDTFPNERFVSLCFVELMSSETGLVLYVNAGHCPPLHYRASTNTHTFLAPTGGILGIIPEQQFRLENINMNRGDLLVLYTDGITEAQDRSGELYGEQRLANIVSTNANNTSEYIAKAILTDVGQFSAKAKYADDKTLIVVKRFQSAFEMKSR